LHSEQLALVDLLVLSAAKFFVGHPWSTTSVLIEQLRICGGLRTNVTRFVTLYDEESEKLNRRPKNRFVRFALK